MKKNVKIYPHVKIGKNAQIGDFVVIGVPLKDKNKGELETIIGKDAIIRTGTIIYAGCKIGDGFQTGDGAKIYWQSEIDKNVSIGTDSYVGHHVKIGKGVRLHTNVFVPEFCVLEDESWLGPHVVLTNTPHPLCPEAKKCLEKKAFVVVGKGAKIGANATILPGIKIGEMALVGAGAVVVEDVPPRKVVVGNPAKVIKDIGDLRCPYHLIAKPY